MDDEYLSPRDPDREATRSVNLDRVLSRSELVKIFSVMERGSGYGHAIFVWSNGSSQTLLLNKSSVAEAVQTLQEADALVAIHASVAYSDDSQLTFELGTGKGANLQSRGRTEGSVAQIRLNEIKNEAKQFEGESVTRKERTERRLAVAAPLGTVALWAVAVVLVANRPNAALLAGVLVFTGMLWAFLLLLVSDRLAKRSGSGQPVVIHHPKRQPALSREVVLVVAATIAGPVIAVVVARILG